MRILLTGGTGFIGRHLLKALEAAGHELLATTRQVDTVASNALSPNIRWITNEQAAQEILCLQPSAVVHLATNYGNSSPASETLQTNVIWPLKLLEASIKAGTPLFVNTDTFFSKPEFAYQHMAAYSSSKKYFLEWGRLTAQNTLTRFLTLRLEHVYGEKDGAGKFAPWLFERLLAGGHVKLTAGTQLRDFIYITDVVSAYMTTLERYAQIRPSTHELGVGQGQAIALRAFIEQAQLITGMASVLEFDALPMREGEIMSSQANITDLRSLGWQPQVGLEEGLARCLNETRRAKLAQCRPT
jgi:nucleoside-diphosphate-sugar epimerase